MHRENQISIFSDCSRACPGRHAHCRKVRSRDVLPHAVEVAVVHTYIDWLHPLTCMRYLRAAPRPRHLPFQLLCGNRNGVFADSCGLCLSPQTAPSRHDGPHLGCPSDVSTQSQRRLETDVCVAVATIGTWSSRNHCWVASLYRCSVASLCLQGKQSSSQKKTRSSCVHHSSLVMPRRAW